VTPLVQRLSFTACKKSGREQVHVEYPDFTPRPKHHGNGPQLGNTRPARPRRTQEPAYEW
jgi:hypothetical protein